MQYYVVMPDGQKYGPADVNVLTQWAAEGRLTQASMLEDASTGQRLTAGQVTGIMWPGAPGMSSPYAGGAPGPGYAQPQQPYGNPPGGFNNPYGQMPAAGTYQGGAYGDGGQKDFTMSVVFCVLGFICCPVLFNGLGIWKANEAKQKGHAQGQTMIVVNIIVMIIAITIGALSFLVRR